MCLKQFLTVNLGLSTEEQKNKHGSILLTIWTIVKVKLLVTEQCIDMNFALQQVVFHAHWRTFWHFFLGQTKYHLWALTVKHHLIFFCLIWKAGFQLHQRVQFNCVYISLMEININNLRMIFCWLCLVMMGLVEYNFLLTTFTSLSLL